MTAVVANWLPRGAFTQEAAGAVLADPVGRWSKRWFARQAAEISSAGMAGEAPKMAEGLCAEGAVVDAELSGHGKRYLLDAMLDVDLSEQRLTEEDHRILDALGAQAVSDLVEILDEFLGGENADKEAERLILCLSISGNEFLRLLLPCEALVPLLKIQFGGARPSGKMLRNRVEALKPMPLLAEGILGCADLALADLDALAVGDVVILDRAVHAPVELRLSGTGQLIGNGKLGRCGDRVSIQF